MATNLPKSIPPMTRVDSSNVHSIGYDPFKKMLYIQFLPPKDIADKDDGDVYRYYNVDESTFEAFQRAPSKGTFVWQYVRDRYDYAKWMGRGWKKGMALQQSSKRKKYWKQKTRDRLKREANRRRR